MKVQALGKKKLENLGFRFMETLYGEAQKIVFPCRRGRASEELWVYGNQGNLIIYTRGKYNSCRYLLQCKAKGTGYKAILETLKSKETFSFLQPLTGMDVDDDNPFYLECVASAIMLAKRKN